MKKTKILAAGLILAASIVTAYYLPKPANSFVINNLSTQDENKSTVQIKKEKKEDKLDVWIDKLANIECQGCGPKFRILDANNRYSYSCLQFQKQTFDDNIRRFYPNIGKQWYSNLIYSCDFQKSLAKRMLEDGGTRVAYNWYTSVFKKGLGLPPL